MKTNKEDNRVRIETRVLTIAFCLLLLAVSRSAADDHSPVLVGIWKGSVFEAGSADPCKPWYFAEVFINMTGDRTGLIDMAEHSKGSIFATRSLFVRAKQDNSYEGHNPNWTVSGTLSENEASFKFDGLHGNCSYAGTVKRLR